MCIFFYFSWEKAIHQEKEKKTIVDTSEGVLSAT